MRIAVRIAAVVLLVLGGASAWADGINVTFEGGSGDVTNITTWGIVASPVANPDWLCVVSDNSLTTSPCPGDADVSGPYLFANHTPGGHWGLRFGTPNDGAHATTSFTFSVPTVAGNTYNISFWIEMIDDSVNSGSLGDVGASMAVTFGGTDVLPTAITVNGPYTLESTVTVLASGPTTNLTFSGLSSLSGDFFIDDILVQNSAGVPEPSTFALLAVPLVGFGAWLRRRR